MAILTVNGDGDVLRHDIEDGTTTLLAQYPNTFTDIAVTPDGRVFGLDGQGVWELDLDTGTRSFVYPASAFSNGLAADAEGNLYISDALFSSVAIVSSETFTLTGAITLPFGATSAGDLHVSGDLLYLASTDERIITIDLNTGFALNAPLHGIKDVDGLFEENGTLYALAEDDLYQVDRNSGDAVRLSSLPVDADITGAASLEDVAVVGTSGGDQLTGLSYGANILARGGDDTVTGSIHADTIEAGAGSDTVSGGSGNDDIFGGTGNDLLRGGRDDDHLDGGDGDDVIRGQRGDDRLSGGAGDDNLKGGGGSDTLEGNANDDFIKGGTRADFLEGGAGDDTLNGNSFGDTLDGGAGDDRLNGGGDNDRLIGGADNDWMRGGTGSDSFVFEAASGQDTIDDFDVGEDQLVISADAVGGRNAALLAASATPTADGLVITLGPTDTILLEGATSIAGLADAIDIV